MDTSIILCCSRLGQTKSAAKAMYENVFEVDASDGVFFWTKDSLDFNLDLSNWIRVHLAIVFV